MCVEGERGRAPLLVFFLSWWFLCMPLLSVDLFLGRSLRPCVAPSFSVELRIFFVVASEHDESFHGVRRYPIYVRSAPRRMMVFFFRGMVGWGWCTELVLASGFRFGGSPPVIGVSTYFFVGSCPFFRYNSCMAWKIGKLCISGKVVVHGKVGL